MRSAIVTASVLIAAAVAWGVGGRVWFHWHLRAAQTAVDAGHNTDATRHLQQCQWASPDHPQVLILRSRVARRSGDPETAETLLDRYANLYGTDDAVAFELLLNRAGRGDVDATAPALKAHISGGGAGARLAREAVISGLMARYRFAGIQAVLGDWLDEAPDDPLALLLKGKFQEGQAALDDAMATYRRAIEVDPDLVEARFRLTHLLVTRRLGGDALAEAAILRARLPDNPQVRVLYAHALALQGRREDAKAEIDECLRLTPEHPGALAERGAQTVLAGDEQAAIADLALAVSLDPGNIAARNQYALALARTGRAADSRREYATVKQLQADLDRVLEIARGPLTANPRDPNALHELGEICVRANQLREARGWFAQALESDPSHAPTHRALAELYWRLGDPVLSARHRALAQRLTPPPKP